jgi:hypothetical protein
MSEISPDEARAFTALRGLHFFIFFSLAALLYLLSVTVLFLFTGGGKWNFHGISIGLESMSAPLSTFWYLIGTGLVILLSLNVSTLRSLHESRDPLSIPQHSSLVDSRRHLLFLILALFTLASAIRLYHIELPPLEFHSARQYNDAIIARHMYGSCTEPLTSWKRTFYTVEDLYLEPPLLELMSTGCYLCAGRECLTMPMCLSLLFWLGGGLAVYKASQKLSGTDGALISLFFFLFLPFSIKASRCFMPDPLMVSLLAFYILMLVNFTAHPGRKAVLNAALAGSGAVFVKLSALFPVLAGAVGLFLIWKEGRKKVTLLDGVLFLSIIAFPSWLYGFFFHSGSLKGKLWGRFLPSLVGSGFTFNGWLGMVDSALGLSLLLVALFSLVLFRGGPRIMMLSLFAGYLLFVSVFNYHSATHDYYHLMLILLVALLLGKGGAFLCTCAHAVVPRRGARAGLQFFFITVLLAFCAGGLSRLTPGEASSQVALYERVGEVVKHSRNTFILASSYGLPLKYHGWVEGFSWPDSSDLRYWAWEGVPVKDPVEFFQSLREKKKPHYFIILWPSEWLKQESLASFIDKTYPLCWSEGGMMVYDLRKGRL